MSSFFHHRFRLKSCLLFVRLGLFFQPGLSAWAYQRVKPEIIDGNVVLPADLLTSSNKLITLSAKWKYQPGDHPTWADVAFDDTNWPLIGDVERHYSPHQLPKDWSSTGRRGGNLLER